MTKQREREVTQAFVSLASSLATGYDVVELLNTLTAACARLLDVSSAGLLLADQLGVLHVLAASTEHTRQLEVAQLQRDEGPCLDCYRTGQPIAVPNLKDAADRWPQFVAAAGGEGFLSVHALPMRLGGNILGALGLFGTTAGALNNDDLTLGQALADVASVALVQDTSAADQAVINEQLQKALTSRVVIEQAKGVLAQQGEIDMAQAFAVLRGYARDNNLRVTHVAQAVASRSLPAQQLLDHAQSRAWRRNDQYVIGSRESQDSWRTDDH
jgi:transcriptional regulator with GAF, ATPase, and Fis domain